MLSEKEKCCGCGACMQACPRNCITMDADVEGFLYPNVDTEKCVQCGICTKVCPVIHEDEKSRDGELCAYAAYNKNESARLVSSSGGIFTALAEKILKQGGVVFGAAMTADCCAVHHVAVENEDEACKAAR